MADKSTGKFVCLTKLIICVYFICPFVGNAASNDLYEHKSIAHDCIQSGNTLIVSGNNIHFTDIVLECNFKIKHLKIFAFDTFVMDTDIILPEMNVAILAPDWLIQNSRKIDLSGLNGTSHETISSQAVGGHGAPGLPGTNAGNFVGLALNVTGTKRAELLIQGTLQRYFGDDVDPATGYLFSFSCIANGGSGGMGQSGGAGRSDVVPVILDMHFNSYDVCGEYFSYLDGSYMTTGIQYRPLSEVIIPPANYWDQYLIIRPYEIYSKCGGYGGNGGRGGIGGHHGNILFHSIHQSNVSIQREKNYGIQGMNGRGAPSGESFIYKTECISVIEMMMPNQETLLATKLNGWYAMTNHQCANTTGIDGDNILNMEEPSPKFVPLAALLVDEYSQYLKRQADIDNEKATDLIIELRVEKYESLLTGGDNDFDGIVLDDDLCLENDDDVVVNNDNE